jgi:hypothetical protein
MESLKPNLAQFKSIVAENPSADEAKKLLTRLKLGLIEINVPSLSEVQQGDEIATIYRMIVYHILSKLIN